MKPVLPSAPTRNLDLMQNSVPCYRKYAQFLSWSIEVNVQPARNSNDEFPLMTGLRHCLHDRLLEGNGLHMCGIAVLRMVRYRLRNEISVNAHSLTIQSKKWPVSHVHVCTEEPGIIKICIDSTICPPRRHWGNSDFCPCLCIYGQTLRRLAIVRPFSPT